MSIAASPAGSPEQSDPASRHWRGNAYALVAGCACSSLGFTCCWPYIPVILRDLGVAQDLELWVGFLVGGFFVMSFLLTPVWGGLADHYGKRTLTLRAGFGMAAGFFFIPWLPNVWALFGFFLWVGAANGYIPGALAMTAATTPTAFTGRALAMVQMGGLVGTALGPALGALLIGLLPRPIDLFWIASALTFSAGAIALLFTREDVVAAGRRFQLTVFRDLAACLRVRGVPLLYGVNAVFAMTFLGSSTVVSLLTLHMMGGEGAFLGHSASFWIGAATLAMTLASMAAAYGWGRTLDRYPVPAVLALALGTAVLGSATVPLAQNPLQLTFARAALGALTVGIQPAVLRLIKEHAPAGMVARALGFAAAVQMVGNGSAPMLAGALASSVGLRGYLVLNTVLLLAMLGLWTLRGAGFGFAPGWFSRMGRPEER